MDDLKLPESANNVIRSLDLSNKELTWTIHHSEHRVSLSLIWTKPKANLVKNGGRHFSHQNASDSQSSRAHNKNTRPQARRQHTNGSGSSAGQSHAASNPATVDTDHVPPPGKKRRHKTPSQYRRDRRKWLEYKARKRSPAASDSAVETKPCAISNATLVDDSQREDSDSVGIDCKSPCKQQIPHLRVVGLANLKEHLTEITQWSQCGKGGSISMSRAKMGKFDTN